MHKPSLRIASSIIALALAWYFYSNGDHLSMAAMLFAMALIIWGYFKNGTVYAAYQLLKKENYEQAEKVLLKTKNPHHLNRSQRSYYHFIKGFIELNKDNLEDAKQEFTKALEFGLRTKNDTAIIWINLADIELKNNDIESAEDHLTTAKQLAKKPQLLQEIERIENAIEQHTDSDREEID